MNELIPLCGGVLIAPVAIRILMIETQMAAALQAADGSIRGPAPFSDRFRNIREYSKTFPQGPLNAKLRHCFWAFGLFAAFGFGLVMFFSPSGPR